MGIWARAMGEQPPRLPRLNVVRSQPGLDYPTATVREPSALLLDVWYDVMEDGKTWMASFPEVDLRRLETSQVRAFVWAVTMGQKFADRSGNPVTIRHGFGDDDSEWLDQIYAAAWLGEMGEAGFVTYGSSEVDAPVEPGLTTILPSWMPKWDRLDLPTQGLPAGAEATSQLLSGQAGISDPAHGESFAAEVDHLTAATRAAAVGDQAFEEPDPPTRSFQEGPHEIPALGTQRAVEDVRAWWHRQTPRDRWAYRGLLALFVPLFLIAGVLVLHDQVTEDSCERANRLNAKIRSLELQDARPVDYTKLDQYPSLAEMRKLYDDSADAIRECTASTFGDDPD